MAISPALVGIPPPGISMADPDRLPVLVRASIIAFQSRGIHGVKGGRFLLQHNKLRVGAKICMCPNRSFRDDIMHTRSSFSESSCKKIPQLRFTAYLFREDEGLAKSPFFPLSFSHISHQTIKRGRGWHRGPGVHSSHCPTFLPCLVTVFCCMARTAGPKCWNLVMA